MAGSRTQVTNKSGAKSSGKTPKAKVLTLDATQAASSNIFDLSEYEKFLHERIKVDGRINNLSGKITIRRVNKGQLEIVSHDGEFSGRYLKYLTKKFLKKQQVRDWLRVVSTKQCAYEIRFFNVVSDDDEADDE